MNLKHTNLKCSKCSAEQGKPILLVLGHLGIRHEGGIYLKEAYYCPKCRIVVKKAEEEVKELSEKDIIVKNMMFCLDCTDFNYIKVWCNHFKKKVYHSNDLPIICKEFKQKERENK